MFGFESKFYLATPRYVLHCSLDHVSILLPFITAEELKSNELNRIAAFNRFGHGTSRWASLR